MPTCIKSVNAQMGNIMTAYHHHHHNNAIVMDVMNLDKNVNTHLERTKRMNIKSFIAQMVDAMNALLRHHLTLEIAETLGLPYGMRKNAYATIAKAKTMVHENVPISRVQYAMAMVT